MAQEFYTIITQAGQEKLMNATTGQKLEFHQFAVGDGNGRYYEPTASQYALVNEKYRATTNAITIEENKITIECLIPAHIGGFTIREIGIFDKQGTLILVGKYPQTEKPVAESGSEKDLYIKVMLELDNAENIAITADPNVVIATMGNVKKELKKYYTKDEVDGRFEGIHKVEIVNHLESSDKDKALSAAQGKILNESKLTNKKRNLTIEDMNNANYPEPYVCSTDKGKEIGLPTKWAFLQYFRHENNDGYGTQIAYKVDGGVHAMEGMTNKTWTMKIRTSNGTTWQPWENVVTSKEKWDRPVTDLNTCLEDGMSYYFNSATANKPGGMGDGIVTMHAYNKDNYTTNFGVQIAYSWWNNALAMRSVKNGDYTPWKEMLTSDNNIFSVDENGLHMKSWEKKIHARHIEGAQTQGLDGELFLNYHNGKPVKFKANDGSVHSLQEVFQSASEGKTKVANTLTGMGTPTSTTATWDQIVNNLKQHKYKIGSYLAANQLDSRYPGRVAFLYNKWAWNYPLCAMDCDDMAYVLVYDINKKAVEIWRSPLTYSAASSDMEIFKSIKIGSTQYSYPYGFPFFADKAFGIYFIEPAAMNKFRYIKIHINGTILVDRTIDVQGTISGKIWAYPVRNLLCITTSSKIYRYDISGTGINKLNEFDISKVLNKDVLCCGTDYIMSVMNYAAKTYDYSGNIHWDIPDFMTSQSYPAWVSGQPPRIGFINNYGAFYLTRLTEYESHYNVFTHWANPYNKTKGILEQPTTTGWYSLSDANMPGVSYSDNCLITAYGGRSNDPEFNYKCRIWVPWVPKFNNGYHINEATGGAFKVKRGIVSAWVSTTQDGFGRVCGIYSEDNVYTVAIVDTMNYSKIIS